MNDINETDMQFREFDKVPSFQEFGAVGSVFRFIVWPIISITGMFFLLSPSFQYLPLTLGCVFTMIYSLKYTRLNFRDLLIPFVLMAIFGLLVTGFTTYFRYIFPIIVILPIFIIKRSNPR